MTVYGYCRVSTDRQADPVKSLAQQKESILRYCALKGLPGRPTVLSDAGESGGTDLASRPAGRLLLESLAAGDHVVIPKVDRGWRSARDCLETLQRWQDAGIHMHLIDPGLDLSTPMGRFFLGFLAIAAEWEREIIRERVTVGVRAKIARDGRCGGVPRFGATPEELETLRLIRCLRTRGLSFRQIADRLNDASVPPRNADRWSPDTVRRAVRNGSANAP